MKEKDNFEIRLMKILKLKDQQDVCIFLYTNFPNLQQDGYGNLYDIKTDRVRPLLNAHMDNVGSKEANNNVKHVKNYNGVIKSYN